MLKRRIISSVIVCLLILTGCSNVRFTTGLNRNQSAKIAGQTVSMDIARLLLAEYKYSYETMFDGAVWEKEIDGVRHQLSQINEDIAQLKFAFWGERKRHKQELEQIRAQLNTRLSTLYRQRAQL